MYAVRALKVGECEIPGPELLWMSAWHEWRVLNFNVVLVQAPSVNLLINAGPPEDLSELNAVWASILGERSRYVRQDEDRITARLAAAGVRPEDITHLVVTPFQLYSTGGIPLFRNAEICVSKRGWTHYHTTHRHPHDNRWTSIGKDVLVYLVGEAWDRVRLLEDEDEVIPGIRTWWAGSHHRATVAVEVDTREGVVVATDAFFSYENLERDHPIGICENIYEAIAAHDRTRRVATHVVPLNEPRVFERYPNGIVVASA